MPVNLNPSNLPIGLFQLTLGGGPNNMTPVTYYPESWDPGVEKTDVNVPQEQGKTRTFFTNIKHYTATSVVQLGSTSDLPKLGATGSVPLGYFPTGSVSTVTLRNFDVQTALEENIKLNLEFISLVV